MSNLQELIAQKDAIDREIKSAQERSSRAEAIAQIQKIMAENALSPADFGGKAAASGTRKPKSDGAVKYRHPETGESWVGIGKRPTWLKAALAIQGAALEHFAAH